MLTGHANGLITINVEEANDAIRAKIRTDLREPYRTLLGHFRHEIGHYYWDRLIWNTPWLEPFRALFGDECDERTLRPVGAKTRHRKEKPDEYDVQVDRGFRQPCSY